MVEGSEDNINFPLCEGLYKEGYGSTVTWLVTDPDANVNYVTWSREDNNWIDQGISTMKSSRSGEDLSIMVNYACRPSRR